MQSQVKKLTDRDKLKGVNPFSKLNPGDNQMIVFTVNFLLFEFQYNPACM